jgi:hypothetical protein
MRIPQHVRREEEERKANLSRFGGSIALKLVICLGSNVLDWIRHQINS